MKVNLCITCAKQLNARYAGGRVRIDTCQNCGKQANVASYYITHEVVAPQSLNREMLVCGVDSRTAFNLNSLARLWGCTLGEAVDSVTAYFVKKREKKK